MMLYLPRNVHFAYCITNLIFKCIIYINCVYKSHKEKEKLRLKMNLVLTVNENINLSFV